MIKKWEIHLLQIKMIKYTKRMKTGGRIQKF